MQTSLGIIGAILGIAAFAAPAQGQNVAVCVQMQSSLERLDCYDRLFRGNLGAPTDSKVNLKPEPSAKAQLPKAVAVPAAVPPAATPETQVSKTVAVPKTKPAAVPPEPQVPNTVSVPMTPPPAGLSEADGTQTAMVPKAQQPVSDAETSPPRGELVTNSTRKAAKIVDPSQANPEQQRKPSWGIHAVKNTKLVVSTSQEQFRNIVGQRAKLSLEIACQNNTTSLRLKFAGNIVASALDTARVRFSVDDGPPEDYMFSVSNDFKAVGLWSGEEAIPVIKTLMDADTLTIEGAPYFSSPVKAGFAIHGLSTAIQPVRGSCNW